ncbi:hypothetical protein V6Z12_D11G315000 [Gossypium hirsutum]
MERFVVNAELLNHPVFVGLLNKSAQEYGYEQKGVLGMLLFHKKSLKSNKKISNKLTELKHFS